MNLPTIKLVRFCSVIIDIGVVMSYYHCYEA